MLSFALYSIVGMAALFILPYYFPKKELVAVSASYDFGFNNSAGIMILFLLCLGLTVHAWLFRRKSYQNIITKHNADLHKIFGICLFLQIIFCLTVWFIMRYTYGMIEATYFITRIHELDIGRKLYSQTDFAYGALMLYIPLLIHRISGLSLQDAYFTSWTLMQCVGFYWFYCVISRFNIDKSAKKIIFIAIFIMTLPVSAGMNYVFFRFITPYMALLFLHDKEDMPTPPPTIVYFTYLVLCNSLTVNISPEIGIVLSLTIFISYAVKSFLNKSILQLIYSITSLISCAIWFWLLPGMLETFSSFVSGGLNWPFVFCYTLVLFFVSIFFMAVNIGSQLMDIRANMNILIFELMACGMIPSALGRCDPGHVFWNGLMVLVLTASFLSKKTLKIYAIAVMILSLHLIPVNILRTVPAYVSTLMENPIAGKVFYSDFGQRAIFSVAKMFGVNEDKIRFRFAKGINTGEVPQVLKDISDVSMPLGGHSTFFVYLSENEKYHYLPFENDQGSGKVIRKNLDALISEKPLYILLGKNWEDTPSPANDTRKINALFVTKYTAQPKHNSNELYRDTVNYIREAYEPVGSVIYSREMLLYRLK